MGSNIGGSKPATRSSRLAEPCAPLSAYRTNSAAARRSAPAAAYGHTACAAVQSATPSCSAGRDRDRDPLRRGYSPDLRPESPPSAPRTAFPRAPSTASLNLPAAEASRCPQLPRPSRAANLLLPWPALQSRIRRAPAALLFRACRRSPAETLQFAPLQIRALAALFRRSHRPPPPSCLPPRPAPPASSTPGYSPSSISTDEDRTYQTRHPPRGARPPAGRPHSSRSQSEPNRASKAAGESPAAADSAPRFR